MAAFCNLSLFPRDATNDILHPRGKWMRQKKYSLVSAQRRKWDAGIFHSAGAVKQGYYTEWGSEERILTFPRIAPHGLPAVCESFFNGGLRLNFRTSVADRRGGRLYIIRGNFVSYEWRFAKFPKDTAKERDKKGRTDKGGWAKYSREITCRWETHPLTKSLR